MNRHNAVPHILSVWAQCLVSSSTTIWTDTTQFHTYCQLQIENWKHSPITCIVMGSPLNNYFCQEVCIILCGFFSINSFFDLNSYIVMRLACLIRYHLIRHEIEPHQKLPFFPSYTLLSTGLFQERTWALLAQAEKVCPHICQMIFHRFHWLSDTSYCWTRYGI